MNYYIEYEPLQMAITPTSRDNSLRHPHSNNPFPPIQRPLLRLQVHNRCPTPLESTLEAPSIAINAIHGHSMLPSNAMLTSKDGAKALSQSVTKGVLWGFVL
ncbi:hypothetical protein CDAR_166691 [Caerostris darwini]|uniref:Uncharacterized protein n=1 Tax=Caerostris darwini TaxID=1538125 RepID=A0AAV4QRV5_9ARAC|nr:hypothetical protein CDAR_166691 [Caerostris darwini]